MTLSAGARLGPYEILAPIGAGGMGEVYRARDTRLGRSVAVKVLAQEFGSRPDVLQRFEREARAVSALNHPNICTLHDVGTENGVPYLVMEYLEGETLAERLTRGALPLPDAIRIAIQIVDALDEAHSHAITHRDLKPGNVMLVGGRSSTAVKLLDFGLARLPEEHSSAASGSPTSLSTIAHPLTKEGTILGTLQYMAPEQLEGKKADHRADIFAFGAMLYEMIAGQKAFTGQSQASLISAIMADDPPPLSSIQPTSPPALDRLIRRCLAKNPEDRWQTARDLVHELRWIAEGTASGLPAQTVAPPRRALLGPSRTAWIAAGALAVGFLTLLGIHLREIRPEEHSVRFLLQAPEKHSFRMLDTPVLSPDGTRVVYGAGDGQSDMLFVRSLDAVETKPLPGTEGGRFPFWSPDSRSVAFFARGKLKKMDLKGGPPVTLSDVAVDPSRPDVAAGGYGGTWNRDDVIVFTPALSGPLMRVAAAGGNVTPVAELDTSRGQGGHAWPSFLPDGKHFLFTVSSSRAESRGVHIGSLDSRQITRVLPEDSNAQYDSSGFLVFNKNDTLMAQPFDAKRLRLTGDRFSIAEHVSLFSNPFSGAAFSTAGGALAYRLASGVNANRLSWFDRRGVHVGDVGQPADYTNPALSPDGRTLAVCTRDPGTRMRDIWLFDLTRGTTTRLTFDPADDFNPVFSPNGQRIAFTSDRGGHRDLYQKSTSGVGAEELLAQSEIDKALEDWTRDGQYLIFNQLMSGPRRETWSMPLSGGRKLSMVLAGPSSVTEAQVSPDGHWIAYTSSESGAPEIYVQNFPPTGGKWQISTAGGRQAAWRRDGKELFYLQGERLMSVDVRTVAIGFEATVPKPLFDVSIATIFRNVYVVAPDGQKFLFITRPERNLLPIVVVLNWRAGLKK
jgi:eukaryotic-like serine/threonine-protein kinase